MKTVGKVLFLVSLGGAPCACESASRGRDPDPINTTASVAAAALPAVVRITSDGDQAQGAGSGFFVSGSNGQALIATNYHVIWGAEKITFDQGTGIRSPAVLVGVDTAIDFALLRPEFVGPVKALTWGEDSELLIGDFLLSIGGIEGVPVTVSVGVLSARAMMPESPLVGQRFVEHLFTDAVISPGSSGGPVLNSRGQVVGMNAAMAGQSRGLGIVIPAALIRESALELERHGHCSHAFGGLEVADRGCSNEVPGAVQIVSVAPGGPADAAGLRVGDCISTAHGKVLVGAKEFRRRLFMAKAGTQWILELTRATNRLRVTLQLGDVVEIGRRSARTRARK